MKRNAAILNRSHADVQSPRLSIVALAVISVLSTSAMAEDQVAPATTTTPSVVLTSTPAAQPEATLERVVVTSRNREEIAQDVPLPVQVLGGAQLDREDIKTVWDLTSKAPNLALNPDGENARKVSPSIRGFGNGSANDSMERSVGVIVDGVTLYYSGQAWSDYVDLDRIEVLRGPQGTLVGKNTSLGAIKILTKEPSFKKSSSFQVTTGSLNTLSGKFAATGPLVDDVLAYRGTFVVDRQDGLYDNTYLNFGKSRETWRETNKLAGRYQLLWTPSADLKGRIIIDKLRSDERTNTGNVLVSNGPATYADGTSRGAAGTYGYVGKWNARKAWFNTGDGVTAYVPPFGTTNIENSEARPQLTNQHGISGQFDWTLGDHTLTSISAYRYQDFDIKNGGQNGPFYIGNSGQQLWNKQVSQELRLASIPDATKALDYQAGLYYLGAEVYSDDPTYFGPDAGAWNASNAQFNRLIATAAGRALLRGSLDGVYQSTVTDAKVDSLAAFGQADFHLSEEATLSLGLRQTKERKTNRVEQQLDRAGQDLTALSTAVGGTATDLADAQAIRAAQVITPFSSVSGTPINASLTAWNVSPSYKVADDVLVYTSLGQGVKSGFIFFDPNNLVPGSAGFEAQIKPEKTLDFELGAKSLLLDRALQLNANVYYTQISDYQATWTRDNTGANAATVPTITQWGNAEKVLARGIEVESAYQVNSNLSLNANGAYNKATYETQWLVAKPELATTQYFDAKGQQIANAPLVTLSYGGNYETSLWGLSARASLSNTYKSSFYFNDNHSENTKQDAYTISNLGLAIGAPNKDWELSLLVKNVFNTEYALSKATWTKTAAQNLRVGNPRYYGLTFKSKF